jgi:ATP-dependent DNA ligase
MRTAITIATKRQGGSVVVAGPEVAIAKQLVDFKAAASAGTHPEYSSIELWHNDAGRTKFVRLREPAKEKPPVQTPAPEPLAPPVNDQEPAAAEAPAQPPSGEPPADAPAQTSRRNARRSR